MTIKEAINEHLSNVEKAYKKDLLRFKASGSTSKSMRKESKVGLLIEGKIYAQRSIMTLFKGRKPGKFPPISAILDWIREKGIKPVDITEKSLAFLIARSIAKKGTKIYQGKTSPLDVDDQINDLEESFGAKLDKILQGEISKSMKAI